MQRRTASVARWAATATLLFVAGAAVQFNGATPVAWWSLYLLCYVAGGWAPVRDGLRALRRGTLAVDLLMVVAAVGAAAVGQVVDGALLIVIFATSGVLEAFATQRTEAWSSPRRHTADRIAPLVLVDRSLAMLNRAAQRMRGHDPNRVAFVQADLFDLPFARAATPPWPVHGLLHLFDDLDAILRALQSPLADSGTLLATSLTAETRRSRWALRQMARTGEAAAPRRQSELQTAVHDALGTPPEVRREGAMVYLSVGPLPRSNRNG